MAASTNVEARFNAPPHNCTATKLILTSQNTNNNYVKPQFEAGRLEIRRRKGVIRDPAVHRQVLEKVLSFT